MREYAEAKIAAAIANPPKPRRKILKGSMPGVGENFTEGQRDRLTPATREIDEIGLSSK